MQKSKSFSLVQRIALVYMVGFFLIVGLNYIPAIHDDKGFMFGLFRLDPIDDIFHLITAIWALIAGLTSLKQSAIFFKVFGLIYTLDGIICLISGQCLADFTIFTHADHLALVTAADLATRIPLNLPHIVIGAIALYSGFVLSKRAAKN